ncbi:hypothetical protein TruAng_001117 [Truncatella angustata]|nr:hypothetical protein TruAng_001117 [Truncatella angustata]
MGKARSLDVCHDKCTETCKAHRPKSSKIELLTLCDGNLQRSDDHVGTNDLIERLWNTGPSSSPIPRKIRVRHCIELVDSVFPKISDSTT